MHQQLSQWKSQRTPRYSWAKIMSNFKLLNRSCGYIMLAQLYPKRQNNIDIYGGICKNVQRWKQKFTKRWVNKESSIDIRTKWKTTKIKEEIKGAKMPNPSTCIFGNTTKNITEIILAQRSRTKT